MTIRILAFGVAKEIISGSSAEISVKDGATISELRSSLEDKYPRLKLLSSFMLALNNEYATGNEIVSEKDEIAIIPPVSGG